MNSNFVAVIYFLKNNCTLLISGEKNSCDKNVIFAKQGEKVCNNVHCKLKDFSCTVQSSTLHVKANKQSNR